MHISQMFKLSIFLHSYNGDRKSDSIQGLVLQRLPNIPDVNTNVKRINMYTCNIHVNLPEKPFFSSWSLHSFYFCNQTYE